MQLALRNVTKRFGAVVANDRISLTVEPGEIHCLLGENGAGKSTLMNVLYGLYQADEGEIVIDGEVRSFAGPGDAIDAGIGMVHQHFMLVPVFTVAENVMLGNESTGFAGKLDLDAARTRVREISDRFGFHVRPDDVVEDLPVGVQQRVEIIKALSRDAEVLVFDEPTAVLTPRETDDLMGIMRQLRESGKAIVFITHKLREVREVADRITVIRHGKVVGEAEPTASNAELASLMVGRPVELTVHKDEAAPGEDTLVVSGLTVADARGHVHVDDISFAIRAGEILAVAGVQGNGQTELTEALLGLQERVMGSIRLDGNELVGRSVRQILDAGVGFVPEDRQVDGLVDTFTIAENLMLDRSHGAPFVESRPLGWVAAAVVGVRRLGAVLTRRSSSRPSPTRQEVAQRLAARFPRVVAATGSLRLDGLDAFARDKVKEYDVRAPGVTTQAGNLSGGNQQKVVVARELSRDLRLLVAAQPTRGVDVGSIEFIHKQVVATRDAGVPVLVVSTELDEVVALADRIMVLYRGQIVGIVPGDTPRETLGLMMTGERPTGAVA